MKGRLLVFFYFFLSSIILQAQIQNSVDGFTADTIAAAELLKSAKMLIAFKDYEKAIEQVIDAKAKYERTVGQSNLLADALAQEGIIYFRQEKYEKTLPIWEEVLRIRLKQKEKQHRKIAGGYFNISLLYSNAGQLKKAIDYKEKAISVLESAFGSEDQQIAQAYRILGLDYYNSGRFNDAISSFREAVRIRRLASDTIGSDLEHLYNSLGIIYYQKGAFNRSIAYRESALEILKRKYGVQHLFSLEIRLSLAEAEVKIGNLSKAQNIYETVLKYHRQLPTKHPTILARVNAGVGVIFMISQDFHKGIHYLENAVAILQESSTENGPLLADFHSNLGISYLGIKNSEKALEHINKSIQYLEDNSAKINPKLTYLFINLGMANQQAGLVDKAILNYKRALGHQRSIFGDKDLMVSFAHFQLAKAYEGQNLLQMAENQMIQALNALEGSKEPKLQEVAILNRRGITLYELGRIQQKRFSVSQELELLYLSSESFKNAQLAFDQMKDLIVNQEHVQLYSANESSNRVSALLTNLYLYHNTKDSSFLYSCYELSERSKANLLHLSMLEANALHFAEVPDSIIQEEKDLRRKLTQYDKLKTREESINIPSSSLTYLEAAEELLFLSEKYDRLKSNLEKNNSLYYQLKYQSNVVSVQYLQDSILELGQTLLEYSVSDSSFVTIVVSKEDFQVIEHKGYLPVKRWVQQFRQGLNAYYGKEEKVRSDSLFRASLKDYITSATQLYQRLIAPIEHLLRENVIIVPDDILGYIPFEALLEHKPTKVSNFDAYPFLFHKHQISYCYSATLLREMKDKVHRNIPKKTLAAFAPFATGTYADIQRSTELDLLQLANGQDSIVYKEVITKKDFRQLPSSGSEAYLAAKIMGGDAFVGEEATEDHFNATAGDYRILHLSTHGIADERVGDYSYLAFAEQKDSLENEFLYVRDLYNLQLNADLVVLSACETASGELKRGEGIISLARAFAYAGAKSILTTLWVVDDAVAKDLTRDFYIHLKQGKTKDQALYLAKQQHLERSNNSRRHPFFWAAMIPVGDMSPIK